MLFPREMTHSDNLKKNKSAERYQESDADELDEPIVKGAIDELKKYSLQGFAPVKPQMANLAVLNKKNRSRMHD